MRATRFTTGLLLTALLWSQSSSWASAAVEPEATDPTTTTTAPTTTAPTTTVPMTAGTSINATWTCVSSPWPWGTATSAQAIAWDPSLLPVTTRLGYTVSHGIYLPAAVANGLTITMQTGGATAYAGTPQASSHRFITSIPTGATYTVSGLAPDEVLSIQSGATFTFTTSAPTTTAPNPPCTDPLTCTVIDSQLVDWRCNTSGCNLPAWTGAAVGWPSWSAYSTNERTGYNSRTTFTLDGELIYPYMGAWADGCTLTARSGRVLIIEWQPGTDMWRETMLFPGQTHVIDLVGAEDGAMIETDGTQYASFSVSIENCTPQPVANL